MPGQTPAKWMATLLTAGVFALAGPFSAESLADSLADSLAESATDDGLPCGPQAMVSFADGAPTDEFRIENRSTDSWRIVRVEIDLAPAVAGVFFDPTGSGAGSSVFQPFVDGGGDARLAASTALSDGGTALTLTFDSFPPGGRYGFTADIDDSGTTATRVSGAEIAGAEIRVEFESSFGKAEQSGAFAPSGVALAGDERGCV
jgi:hypothetical protein